MKNFQPHMFDHFSKLATSYNNIRTTDLEPILFAKERVDGHQRIEAADIGCGAGRYCLKLFQHLDNLHHLACIDINDAMLERTSAYLREAGITNFKMIKSLAEDVPLSDDSMDCVFTFNAIHHFDFLRFMAEMARLLKNDGCIFIYTRLRSQNARNIWGRYFPLFLEKEDRLYELDEIEEMITPINALTVEHVEEFKFWRNSTLSQLLDLARNSHYSTFSLYQKKEFEVALRRFEENIARNFSSSGKIGWFDEYTMLVIRKGLE